MCLCILCSDHQGDRPRPLPDVKEINKGAVDLTERKGAPAWDYDVRIYTLSVF